MKKLFLQSSLIILVFFVLSSILRLGSNLALTRLLIPEMFGLMAVVIAVKMLVELMADVGLSQNVVQSDKAYDERFLRIIWTVQILRGFFLALCIVIVAFVLYFFAGDLFQPGSVYFNEQLPILLVVSSTTAITSGFRSPYLYILKREVRPLIPASIEFFSTLSGIVVMIILAKKTGSIWSLVAGDIFTQLVWLLLSHVLGGGYRMRLAWDSTVVKEIFSFGKWIFLSSVAGIIILQGDRLLLAGMITPAELGYYSIAATLAYMLVHLLGKIGASISYPTFRQIIREEPEKIKSAYYRVRFFVDALVIFCACVLFLSAETIISILYDPRYLPAGGYLKILAVSLIFIGFDYVEHLFVALHKPKYSFYMKLTHAMSLVICMFIGINLGGVHGAIWGLVLSPLPKFIVAWFIMSRVGIFSFLYEMRAVPVILAGLTIGYFVDYLLKVVETIFLL